jgi:hypothetical protein
MRDIVLLDSGPLGPACGRRGIPAADRCRSWIDTLLARGVEIILPEVVDDEVRRELIRVGASGSLRRLESLVLTGRLRYVPITAAEWRQAAHFWAIARNRGTPTAAPDALDADMLLAACAVTIGRPGDRIVVATTNIRHLAQFCVTER